MVSKIIAPLKMNPRLIIFGVLSTFFSGAGQTFVVSLLTPSIIEAFDLSLSGFAMIYMSATLTAAFFIPFLGRLLDRSHFLAFSVTMGVLLSLGCLILSYSPNTLFLFIGFALIRCFGQGAMSLIAQTGVARGFVTEYRGKALGLITLGYPLAEAILPIAVVSILELYGWRYAWGALSGAIALFFIPGILFLLKSSSTTKQISETLKKDSKQWTLPMVLKDYRFYLLQIQTMITPGVLTALFLWQARLGEEKAWGLSTFASAFVGYAIASAAMGVFSGALIDRFEPRRLLAIITLPLAIGVFVFWKMEPPVWAFVYLALCGVTVGIAKTTKATFLANYYGTAILGSTRGVNFLVAQSSTAVFPVLAALLIENSNSSERLFQSAFALSCLGVVIGFFLAKLYKQD